MFSLSTRFPTHLLSYVTMFQALSSAGCHLSILKNNNNNNNNMKKSKTGQMTSDSLYYNTEYW